MNPPSVKMRLLQFHGVVKDEDRFAQVVDKDRTKSLKELYVRVET
jgi:hypothetical protein